MVNPNLRGPILLSITAAVLTIAMKTTAYLITGSVGLLSDALESGINLLAALTAFFSLWYSARPADPTHAFGHEKIEFFSSGMEGVLVAIAGLGTAWYAIHRLLVPEPLDALGVGAAIAIAASVINLIVARQLLHVGRKYGSLLLEADGHHLMTDVWTSVAVVLGLGLVALTNYQPLDSLMALAVSLHIVVTGIKLIRRSFNGLMDHALPQEEVNQLRGIIEAHLPPGTHFHLLRTRQAGRRKFADFHLLVDGDQVVREAHALAHSLENRLRQEVPELEVSIHLEPIDERDSWESDQLQQLGEPSEPLAIPGTVAPPKDN